MQASPWNLAASADGHLHIFDNEDHAKAFMRHGLNLRSEEHERLVGKVEIWRKGAELLGSQAMLTMTDSSTNRTKAIVVGADATVSRFKDYLVYKCEADASLWPIADASLWILKVQPIENRQRIWGLLARLINEKSIAKATALRPVELDVVLGMSGSTVRLPVTVPIRLADLKEEIAIASASAGPTAQVPSMRLYRGGIEINEVYTTTVVVDQIECVFDASQEERALWQEAVWLDGKQLASAPDWIKDDLKVVYSAMLSTASALNHASESLRKNPDLMQLKRDLRSGYTPPVYDRERTP